jgi:hypothetical protein
MSKPSVHFNDYVSIAVMLLMVVALVAGQADASGDSVEEIAPVTPIVAEDNRLSIDLNGQLTDKALQLSIAIVTDLSHFRGEDE